MIDNDRFRLGVCMIICNPQGKVLWAKRRDKESWQFPQGGILKNEAPEEALYRELEEETGLTTQDTQLLGSTQTWLTYVWPDSIRFPYRGIDCIGQKQKWFLLRLISDDTKIYLNNTQPPEFVEWQWVDYWYPVDHVVSFKKTAYSQALHELAIHKPRC
jgi:putative (di)nucleoside polyphosphate hydrolase